MKEKAPPEKTFEKPGELAARAEEILHQNDMGGWTKASPGLYPHQWSWDSAFIAVGLAHLDTRRAAQELVTLFDHQWATGKVPHIVFNMEAPPDSYYPGPEHWATAAPDSPDAPPTPAHTSGLCQPPVHAIAVRHIWEAAGNGGEDVLAEARGFLEELYPKLFAWHQYLATTRDPEESGLVTIYHPWESGTDNSPRWNAALERCTVGDLPSHPRPDLQDTDPSERPTEEKYYRYIWLVDLIKDVGCNEGVIYESHPFLVKDVLFSAILVRANEALLEIAGGVGASDEERSLIQEWIERGLQGLEECWDPKLRLCLDYDLRAAEPLPARTVGGFAPLISGTQNPGHLEVLLEVLDSPTFVGDPRLRWALPPSTSPQDPEFHPRRYWRGPVWPVFNWLLWWSLIRAGEPERAERLRSASLEQLESGGFGEYYEPFTGEALGSEDQSWTAAVALDWLANQEVSEKQ
ncbi:MAG: glycogen debranching protein [Rubrobacteraceae bacterium]|nr:glycogen debranching protein [Rubrobacteraceae bacterium]